MTDCSHLDILPVIEGYLRVTGTAPSTFGKAALNDPGFVSRLRKGCQPRLDTIDRVLDHLDGMAELLAASERRCAEPDLRVEAEVRAEYAAIVAEADSYGIDLINRTMSMPVHITALGQAVEKRA